MAGKNIFSFQPGPAIFMFIFENIWPPLSVLEWHHCSWQWENHSPRTPCQNLPCPSCPEQCHIPSTPLFREWGPGSWGCGKENCDVAEHLHLKDLELPLGISGKKGLLKAGKWYLQMWLRSVLFHCCPFKFRFFFTSVGSLKSEPTVVKKNLDIKGHQWKIILPAIWEFFPAG